MRTIGILSVLPVERNAIDRELKLQQRLRALAGQTRVVSYGRVGNLDVFHACCTAEGNVEAQHMAGLLVQEFELDLVVLSGIAGGLGPHPILGDVIIGNEVVYYELQKVRKPVPEYRPKIIPFGQLAQDLSRGYLSSEHFAAIVAELEQIDGEPRPPTVHLSPVASGDKVLADGTSHLVRYLTTVSPKARAIEMEAYGAYYACKAAKIPFLSVRGISDRADAEKNDIAHSCASRNAARVVRDFLMYIADISHPEVADPLPDVVERALAVRDVGLLSTVYPAATGQLRPAVQAEAAITLGLVDAWDRACREDTAQHMAFWRGRGNMLRGRYDLAWMDLKNSVECGNGGVDLLAAYRNLGNLYSDCAQYELASACFDSARALVHADANGSARAALETDRGRLCIRQGKDGLGRKYLETAISLSQQQANLWREQIAGLEILKLDVTSGKPVDLVQWRRFERINAEKSNRVGIGLALLAQALLAKAMNDPQGASTLGLQAFDTFAAHGFSFIGMLDASKLLVGLSSEVYDDIATSTLTQMSAQRQRVAELVLELP